jgi:hypothetical protein
VGLFACVWGLALAQALWVFVVFFMGVQLFSNMSSAPFNGLIPDIVPILQVL